ncbi:hypothetical protein DFH11DRAFT_1648051, partial [Phellopilus nigrolimitatus]
DTLFAFPSILFFYSPFLFVSPHLTYLSSHPLSSLHLSAAFFLIVSSTHLYILQHSFHVYIYNTLTISLSLREKAEVASAC